MKLLTKKFREPVFDNDYLVVVGDEEKAEKWLQKTLPEYTPNIDNAYACALHYTGKKRATIIWFSEVAWKDKEYIHDTIAHEGLHATIRSLMQHGIKFDEDNHEIFCYTLGWIVRNIYDLRNKK
jgi:hypothetical protein